MGLAMNPELPGLGPGVAVQVGDAEPQGAAYTFAPSAAAGGCSSSFLFPTQLCFTSVHIAQPLFLSHQVLLLQYYNLPPLQPQLVAVSIQVTCLHSEVAILGQVELDLPRAGGKRIGVPRRSPCVVMTVPRCVAQHEPQYVEHPWGQAGC